VKLLTYVTIFYLPLAFCAVCAIPDPRSFHLADKEFQTLWAVPDNFGGMHIFAIVITVVSVTTYFVVFNLNHLTFYLVTLHHYIRDPLTDWMNSETGEHGKPSPWTEHGRRFRRWKPGQPEPPPSEWLILWYGIFCVARAVGIIQIAEVITRVACSLRRRVWKTKRERERLKAELA